MINGNLFFKYRNSWKGKIKQLNDINWIEIGYKEGDTFSVYGKEYAIDSSGHINVSAEDEFTSTEIKYPSRSI